MTDTLLIENETTPPYSVRKECVQQAFEQIIVGIESLLKRKELTVEVSHSLHTDLSNRYYHILGLSSMLLNIFKENYLNNVKLCSFSQGRINYILEDEIKKSQTTLKRTSVSVNVDTIQQSTDLDTISTETVQLQKKRVKL